MFQDMAIIMLLNLADLIHFWCYAASKSVQIVINICYRVIPLTIICYRYLMVCRVDFCLGMPPSYIFHHIHQGCQWVWRYCVQVNTV
jgi:hypothetical protein